MAPLVDNEENAVINWCTGYKNPGIVDVGTDLEVRIRESLKQTWRSWHLPVRLHCPTFRKFCKNFAREPALM